MKYTKPPQDPSKRLVFELATTRGPLPGESKDEIPEFESIYWDGVGSAPFWNLSPRDSAVPGAEFQLPVLGQFHQNLQHLQSPSGFKVLHFYYYDSPPKQPCMVRSHSPLFQSIFKLFKEKICHKEIKAGCGGELLT